MYPLIPWELLCGSQGIRRAHSGNHCYDFYW